MKVELPRGLPIRVKLRIRLFGFGGSGVFIFLELHGLFWVVWLELTFLLYAVKVKFLYRK